MNFDHVHFSSLVDTLKTFAESKVYKAVVIRIDSPGGDALASDL